MLAASAQDAGNNAQNGSDEPAKVAPNPVKTHHAIATTEASV
jgi:hypothetical protein